MAEDPDVLGTPRLRLTPVGDGDVPDIMVWWNDPTVRRVHGLGTEPLPEAAVRQWLAEPGRAHAWIARRRGSGARVGVIEMSPRGGGAAGTVFELGIAVDAARRGRGLGPEMIERLCAWAFDAQRAAAVVAEVRLDNAAALRVFRAAGFVEQGIAGEVVRMRRARPATS